MFRRQNLTLLTLVFKGLDVPTKELMHGSNLDAIPAPPMTHVVTAVTEPSPLSHGCSFFLHFHVIQNTIPQKYKKVWKSHLLLYMKVSKLFCSSCFYRILPPAPLKLQLYDTTEKFDNNTWWWSSSTSSTVIIILIILNRNLITVMYQFLSFYENNEILYLRNAICDSQPSSCHGNSRGGPASHSSQVCSRYGKYDVT